MEWTYTYHRFTTESAYRAAVAPWLDAMPQGVSLDVIGTISTSAEPPIALPGWHVNAAWKGVEVPAAFAAAEIYPETPTRMFAGSEEP